MMTLATTYSVIVLVLLIGASAFGGRPFVVQYLPFLFATIVAGLFLLLGIEGIVQYHLWSLVALQKFLLPPHQPITYFLTYVFWRLFAPYVFSFIVAMVVGLLARIYNRRHDNALFYDDEFFMLQLGVALSGTPGWIFYLLAMAIVAGAINVFRAMFLRQTDKFPLRELWLPVALFVILMNTWAAGLPGFALLRF